MSGNNGLSSFGDFISSDITYKISEHNMLRVNKMVGNVTIFPDYFYGGSGSGGAYGDYYGRYYGIGDGCFATFATMDEVPARYHGKREYCVSHDNGSGSMFASFTANICPRPGSGTEINIGNLSVGVVGYSGGDVGGKFDFRDSDVPSCVLESLRGYCKNEDHRCLALAADGRIFASSDKFRACVFVISNVMSKSEYVTAEESRRIEMAMCLGYSSMKSKSGRL